MKKVTMQVRLDPEIAEIYRKLRKKWKTTNEGVFETVALSLKEK